MAVSVVVAIRAKRTGTACLRILRGERRVRVVGVARSAGAALASVRLKPDVLLLGEDLFGGDGVALLRALRVETPRTKVILVTGRASTRRILDALAQGARGYLERKALPEFLARAVQQVDAGEAWVPRRMVAEILDRLVRIAAQAGTAVG